MLQLDELKKRYSRLMGRLVTEGLLSKSGAKVMEALLWRGEIPRGEVPNICGVKQHRATQVIKELQTTQVTHSESAYGPLRLNISADMAAILFPELA